MALRVRKLELRWFALPVTVFCTWACTTSADHPTISSPNYEAGLEALGLPPKAEGDLNTAWEYYLFLQSNACIGGPAELCELYERAAIDAHIASELQKFVGQVREESRPFGLEYGQFLKFDEVIKVSDNTWLQDVLGQIGWFDISTYERDADKAAFMLIHHSNNTDWQIEAMKHMRSAQLRGETDPRNVALLHDRIATRKGEPQRFATQGSCIGEGAWAPSETEGFETVDARRQEMGLAPMSQYVAQMSAMCGG